MTATRRQLQRLLNFSEVNNTPVKVTTAAAAGASNVSEVTFTVKNGKGDTILKPTTLIIHLSDAATGEGLTATTASGAVAAKASSGTDLSTLVSKKALMVQTKANGTYILSITDSAKTTFYPCATIPGSGEVVVGTRLATASYG